MPAADVSALWREYEDQATPESHLVKDFDKLEMIMQVGAGAGMVPREWFLPPGRRQQTRARTRPRFRPTPPPHLPRIPCAQAHEYEQAQGIRLQQFFDSTAGKFKTETGCAARGAPLLSGAGARAKREGGDVVPTARCALRRRVRGYWLRL